MANKTNKATSLSFTVTVRQAFTGGKSRVTISGPLKTKLLRCAGFRGRKASFVICDSSVPGILSDLFLGSHKLAKDEQTLVDLTCDIQAYFFPSNA